jgi:hypothetical protein
MNFNFQLVVTFVFLSLHKMVGFKVDRPHDIYQHVNFCGPTVIGTSFAPTSEVQTFAILEWFKLQD